jgi:hypothetical protein
MRQTGSKDGEEGAEAVTSSQRHHAAARLVAVRRVRHLMLCSRDEANKTCSDKAGYLTSSSALNVSVTHGREATRVM